MQANKGYIANSSSPIVFTMPAAVNVGDSIAVSGLGTGGWQLVQNSGQVIHNNGSDTTPGAGGGLETSDQYASINLLCVTDDTDFSTQYSIGTITNLTPAPLPTYIVSSINSLPAVRFTNDQYLTIPEQAAFFGVHLSIFVVWKVTTSSGSTWMIVRNQNPGETGSWLFGATLGDDKVSFYANSTQTKSSHVIANGSASQQSMIYDGVGVKFRHNGSADTTSPNTSGSLTDNGGSITLGAMNNFGGDVNFTFDLAEFLFYNTDVSNGNRDSIEGYLMNKYGLGAGSAFDPTTVSGLQVWLKAGTLSLSNGAPVSTWTDSSGNGNDATQ